MSIRVAFLDFDGVLIHADCYFCLKANGGTRTADPACMYWLTNIVRQADLRIVISSSWRCPRALGKLRAYLQSWGLPGARRRVIGMTPELRGRDRAEEIAAWLSAHPEVTEYVIIDDDPIGTHPGIDLRRLVNVRKGWWAGGLRAIHAERAARILRVKDFRLGYLEGEKKSARRRARR